jgi:hypothetical protein
MFFDTAQPDPAGKFLLAITIQSQIRINRTLLDIFAL